MANKIKGKQIFEIVWYSICGGVGLWGLTYIVLGIVAQELTVHSTKNPLLQASNTIQKYFGLGLFHWGLIILAIAAVAAIIVLLVFAKRVDRDFEKTQRRAARRSATLQEETSEIAE